LERIVQLYADDVILLAPVCALQSLVDVCMIELQFLDMAVRCQYQKMCMCVFWLPVYKLLLKCY